MEIMAIGRLVDLDMLIGHEDTSGSQIRSSRTAWGWEQRIWSRLTKKQLGTSKGKWDNKIWLQETRMLGVDQLGSQARVGVSGARREGEEEEWPHQEEEALNVLVIGRSQKEKCKEDKR
jgi:hypothetical protein